MLREKVAKLTKLLFAGATMALCVATVNPAVQVQAGMLEESEPNNRPGTANRISLNTWVTGEMTYSDEDWFQFTIPAGRGYTWFQIKPTMNNVYDDSNWSITLKDSDNHTLLDGVSGHSFNTLKYGWKPGKYYVQIRHSYTREKDDYMFITRYTKSSDWEAENYWGNKKYGDPNYIYVNKQYTGNIYCNNDTDYYRVKLNGTNKVSLKFDIDDSVSHPGSWRIAFAECKSRKPLGEYTVNSNDTVTIPKCTGDLMIEIKNDGYNSATGQIYHIKASVKTNTIVKPIATTISSIKAGKRQATVYWRKANNATGYYVYRSTNSKSGYKKIATVTGKTYYTDKKSLTSKKTYYYKVVSIRKSGSKVLKANSSACKSVKIK